MKPSVIISILLITALCLCACSANEAQSVEVYTEESMLVDFYEESSVVHFVCSIKLCNHTSKNQTIKIMGTSQEDVEGGLLADPHLIGYSQDQSDTFQVDANSCRDVIVDFRGVYAGVLVKNDRLIPDVIEIEVL